MLLELCFSDEVFQREEGGGRGRVEEEVKGGGGRCGEREREVGFRKRWREGGGRGRGEEEVERGRRERWKEGGEKGKVT